eukprot:s2841_g11.t1
MQEHESLSRTALQSAMEVFHLKSLVETTTGSTKLSAQALSSELVKAGLQQIIGGSKIEEDEAENGSLTPGFISQALAVHRTIMSQPRVIELLLELESRYGTRSAFHKMSKLHVLAVKPASAKTRVWILESLVDWLSYNLVKELVFGKKFDHGVKQAAKQGGAAEQVFEQEPVQEAWQRITNELAKESEERKAAASLQGDAPGTEEEEEEAVSVLRKPPSSFELHSTQYWKSVANQAVRTYVTLCPEPKTLSGVVQAVAQSNVKNIAGTQGESSVVLWLDMDSLGESQGPGQQPLLRKKFNVEQVLMRKLIQGAMLGRGAQRRENDEATKVKGDLDSEFKEVLVVFDDTSIRNRKQRVRGGYSSHTCMAVASSTCLTQCLPEKQFTGHSTSNVVQGVKALSPTDLWHTSRSEKVEILGEARTVEVTAEAAEKRQSGEQSTVLESVFSASLLPVNFFRDMLRGHSAKPMVDLSCGQGFAARACLLERLPYFGFVLSEAHGKKIEMQLTDFVLTEMRNEGSSHYRPEACQEPSAETGSESAQPKKQKSETAPKGEPKPKKPRKTSKKEDETEEVPAEAAAAGEEEEKNSPLPW